MLSCKDFKNWESIYECRVKVTFEPEKDDQALQAYKDLQSYKLDKIYFVITPIITNNDVDFLLRNSELNIRLNPDADAVSFELESANNMYHQKVTIHYKRIVSLISTEAGGLQIQYLIKRIQLHTKDNKRPIFKKFTIEHPMPLQEEKEKMHVTLYY